MTQAVKRVVDRVDGVVFLVTTGDRSHNAHNKRSARNRFASAVKRVSVAGRAAENMRRTSSFAAPTARHVSAVLLDDLPELLGIKPEAVGAQQRAVDGARLVDLPPHIRAVAVETLRTLTHVVVWAGAEDVSAAEKMLQKSPRRPLPGFFRADFSNLLSVLAECCGPGVRPIVVRVATPNASLSAAVNDVLSSVAEKAAIEVVWVEPVWEAGSAAPATAADENAMSLAPVPTLDYRATLAKVVEALVTTPSM